MTGGLILAAGDGSRFGPESKLVQDLGGIPLLEHAVRAMCAVSTLKRVVVVLGAHAAVVQARVDFDRGEPVVCERWSDGLAESLQFGVRALMPVDRVIVTLGDSPTVTSAVIERVLAAPAGARAVYEGRSGHPAVLGPEQLQSVLCLSGDSGARGLLNGPRIECSDLCSGRDVDTPSDLQDVRASFATTRGCRQ